MRRDVRDCVLFLFLFFVVNLLVSGIVMAVAFMRSPEFLSLMADPAFLMDYMTGDLSEETGAALSAVISEALDGTTMGLMSIFGIVVASLVFVIYRKRRFFGDVMMPAAEPMTVKVFVVLVVVTQAVQCVFSLLSSAIESVMPEGMSLEESYGAAVEALYTPVGLVYIVLIGPIFEELVFRGAVLGGLRKYGNNFAIIFSSLLFGFYHAIIAQIPFAIVVGLLFGYVAVRWSLRASIVLHIVVNGLSVLLSFAGSGAALMMGGVLLLACVVVSVGFGIAWREQLKVRVQAGAAYYANTYINGFSSIAFWIFIFVMTLIGVAQISFV